MLRRRALALLLGVAAVACTRSPPVSKVEVVTRSLPASCPTAPAPQPIEPRLAAILRELDEVDRELDIIDSALIAAESSTGMTREAAQIAASKLAALAGARLGTPSIVAPTPEPTFLMARIAARYYEAKQLEVELAKDYGPRHAVMLTAAERIAQREREYELQRDAEVAYATAWTRELAKLPPSARPADVTAARRRAFHHSVDGNALTGFVPSDAPTGVLVVASELGELRRRRDDRAFELGPKHPEMLALDVEIREAGDRLRRAIADAMSASPKPQAPIDGAMIARRTTLATRAQLLRRELAVLQR